MSVLATAVGRVTLKNPLIAGAAEHLIDAAGAASRCRCGGRQIHQ